MKLLRFTLGLICAVLVQALGARYVPHLPMYFDPFLILVVYHSLDGSPAWSSIGGSAAGLAQDALSGGPYGLHGFANTLGGLRRVAAPAAPGDPATVAGRLALCPVGGPAARRPGLVAIPAGERRGDAGTGTDGGAPDLFGHSGRDAFCTCRSGSRLGETLARPAATPVEVMNDYGAAP